MALVDVERGKIFQSFFRDLGATGYPRNTRNPIVTVIHIYFENVETPFTLKVCRKTVRNSVDLDRFTSSRHARTWILQM